MEKYNTTSRPKSPKFAKMAKRICCERIRLSRGPESR